MIKFTEEQEEDVRSFAQSTSRELILAMIDDIVKQIEGNVLSVPLDKDPEKAAISLYAERMKYEGAVALRNSFNIKLNDLRRKR